MSSVRVVGEDAFEVDLILTMSAEVVMHEWNQLQRNIMDIDGVQSVKILDPPLGIVRQVTQMMTDKTGESTSE